MRKMTKRQNRILRVVLALVIAVSAVGGAIGYSMFKSNATYDPNKAITFKELNAKKPIEDRFFFVGTYVFALDAITDEMYSKALNSQSDMNQFNNYYKSELAGGMWYDISDASDLSYITSTGTPVSQEEIDPLYVTVYIDKDGKVYDAKTFETKSLYDLPDPYDLKQIPELNALYTMYQAQFSENSKGVDEFYYYQLKDFFDTDLRVKYPNIAAQTKTLDERLKNLQRGYEGLQEMGKNAEADVIDDLMHKVDSTRRAVIYKQLAIGWEAEGAGPNYELNMLLKVLNNKDDNGVANIENEDEIEQSTQPYDVWTNSKKQYTYDQIYKYMKNHDGVKTVEDSDDNDIEVDSNFTKFFEGTIFEGATSDKEVFKPNEGIISTLYDADGACKATYNDLMKDSIDIADSHIGKAITNIQMQLFNEAENGYTVTLIALVEELVRYNSIADNIVKDKYEELNLINNGLFDECENGFKSAAIGGVGVEYQSAVAQGANDDGLTSALEMQEAALNKEMIELQFIITAKKMRTNTKTCFQQTLEWIDWTHSLLASVPDDAFASRAKIAINAQEAWLTDLLKQLAKEDSSLQSELDKLLEQKAAINAEKMKALDNNDLNGAKKADAKLEEIDKLIDEETAKAGNTKNDDDASASDKAAAAVGLAGTSEGAIEDLKNAALDKLANGEDASDEIDALKQLGAEDALAEIGADSDNSGEKDSGSGKYNLSEEQMMKIIADIMGKDFDSLSQDGKVVAAVAVDRYGALGNVAAQNLARNLIEKCAVERNKYVYDTYVDGGRVYISLVTLGKVSGYRYVYTEGGKNGTLAEGKDSYSFASGDKVMTINSNKTSCNMPAQAVYKYGALYIPEATVNEYFEYIAESIDKATYSAVLNKSMDSKAKELTEALKNGGK